MKGLTDTTTRSSVRRSSASEYAGPDFAGAHGDAAETRRSSGAVQAGLKAETNIANAALPSPKMNCMTRLSEW